MTEQQHKLISSEALALRVAVALMEGNFSGETPTMRGEHLQRIAFLVHMLCICRGVFGIFHIVRAREVDWAMQSGRA